MSQIYEVLKDQGEWGIALLALFVTLWNLKLQREHNRKSVTPNLHIDTTLTNAQRDYLWELYNHGIGPAVVKEMSICLGGAKVSFPSPADFTNKLSGLNLPAPKEYHIFEKGDHIKAGAEIILLKFDPAAIDAMPKQFAGKLGWKIVYTDVYQQEDKVIEHEF